MKKKLSIRNPFFTDILLGSLFSILAVLITSMGFYAIENVILRVNQFFTEAGNYVSQF